MAQQLARDASAVFEKEPHVYLPLSQVPSILSRNYDSMVRCIEAEARTKSASENGGTPRLLCWQPMVVEHEPHFLQRVADCQYVHATIVLPRSGLLVLVIRPPARWGCYEKGPDGQLILARDGRRKLKQVEVLFRLGDMYTLGFQHSNLWRICKDVKLKGLVSGANRHRYVKKLPFNSSYGRDGMQVDFSNLRIGGNAMLWTYRVLSNNSFYSLEDTMKALSVVSVTVSEATRRRFLQRRVFRVFASNESEVVDNDPEDPASNHIHGWAKDCSQVTKGLNLEGLNAEAAEKERKEHKWLLEDLGAIKWPKKE